LACLPEIDEDAVQWLKKNWLSPIGLYVSMWGHPKIPGFVAPDANIKALKANPETGRAG